MGPRAVHVGTVAGDGIHWHTTVGASGEVTFADGHREWVHERTTIDSTQPDHDGLRPPLVEGAWQRVDLVGLEWTPDPGLGFERRVDGWTPRTLDTADRASLELLDPHLGFSTYTFGTTPLVGVVAEPGGVAPVTSLVVAAVFVVIVLGFLLARRLLARQVRKEEADEYMAREFRDGG